MPNLLMSCLAAKAKSPTPTFLGDVVFTHLSGAKPRSSSRMLSTVTQASEPPCLLFSLPVLLFPLHLAGHFWL